MLPQVWDVEATKGQVNSATGKLTGPNHNTSMKNKHPLYFAEKPRAPTEKHRAPTSACHVPGTSREDKGS